jgi:MFS family permease
MPIRSHHRAASILIATLMLTQTIGWGTSISLIGVLAAPMGASLGLERATIYIGISVMFIVGAAVAPLSGRLVDRIGGLNTLCLGTPLFGVALGLLSIAQGPASYFAAWGIFGLGMHAALATAAYAALAQVLGRNSYRGIGVLTLATGLCSTLFWPLSEAALQIMDWRTLCGVYAAATLLVSFPAHLALARLHGRAPNRPVTMPAEESLAHVPPELAPRAFRLLATMVTLTHCVGMAMGILAIDLFVTLGTPREAAVFAASLIGVAFLVSRGIDVALGNRIPRMALARLVFAMLPLSLLPLLAFAVADEPLPVWLAAVSAVLYGLPAGLLGILRPVLPFHIFGSFGYGCRLGRLARPMDLASALAPFGFAWLITWSPQYALWTVVGMSAAAFLAVLALARIVSDGPNHRHYPASPIR